MGQHENHRFPNRDGYWGSGRLINEYYQKHPEYSDNDYTYEILCTTEDYSEADKLELDAIRSDIKENPKNINISINNLPSIRGSFYINDGEEEQTWYDVDIIPEGWKIGALSSHNLDLYLYNNGKEQHFYEEGTQPEGYKLGRLSDTCGTLGCSWYNNGIEDRMYFDTDTIPDGFVKGRLAIDDFTGHNLDQKWYNNGKQPDGWVLGMLPGIHAGERNSCYGKSIANNGKYQAYFTDESEFPDNTWHWGSLLRGFEQRDWKLLRWMIWKFDKPISEVSEMLYSDYETYKNKFNEEVI